MDPAEYCRAIETYLCRKNEGHLIRIVGPVFEQVAGWAAQGIPLAVVCRGIDAYCDRYYAKGPRRRPVRIEFCEADILELFDGWRRAVGVSAGGTDAGSAPKKDSLPAHLERVINRLTALRGGECSAVFESRLAEAVRELDASRATARNARGEPRAALVARLAVLDRELLESARLELPADRQTRLREAAATEIAPFAARMTADARARAIEAAYERLVRETIGLPTLSPEP